MIGRFSRHYILPVGLMVMVTLSGCGESGNAAGEEKAVRKKRAVNVIVSPVQIRSFTNYLNLVGEVKPRRRVVVSIEANGMIERIAIEKGQWVKKNTVLAEIEDDLLQAEIREVQASLKASTLNLNNQKKLFDQKAAAESAYLDTQYLYDIAKARLTHVQARLNKTIIQAPISGVIDDRFLEEGELAIAGVAFVEIVEIDRVKIVAGVPERYLRYVQKGTEAVLNFPAYPDTIRVARVTYVGTTLDPDSRTVPIEIEISNSDYILKPEMATTIRVVKDYIPETIVIPQDAVIDTDQGMVVFIVDGNMAKAMPVTLGSVSQDQAVVTEGLDVDMPLITVGHRDLVNGELVEVKEK